MFSLWTLLPLFSLYCIPSPIHAIDCDEDCYTLTLNDLYPLQPISDVWCYEYRLEFNASCTFHGDVRILFAVDDDECYLSRMEFEENLISVDPSQFLVYQSPVGAEVMA